MVDKHYTTANETTEKGPIDISGLFSLCLSKNSNEIHNGRRPYIFIGPYSVVTFVGKMIPIHNGRRPYWKIRPFSCVAFCKN